MPHGFRLRLRKAYRFRLTSYDWNTELSNSDHKTMTTTMPIQAAPTQTKIKSITAKKVNQCQI